MKYRQKEQDKRASRHTREDCALTANFHIKAVQALNDAVMTHPNDTAELDDYNARRRPKA